MLRLFLKRVPSYYLQWLSLELEPQMIKANGWKAVAEILDRKFETEGELLEYMVDNKADCALKFFETEKPWKVPEYIAIAIG